MASIIKADTLQSTTSNVFILNSSGTEYARFDSSGNMGIGEGATVPAKLSVRADGDATFGSQFVISANTLGSNTKLTFNSTISSAIGGTSDGTLVFYGNGANDERMRINSSGNVGIGTATAGAPQAGVGPSYKLDIFAGALGESANNQIIAQRFAATTNNNDFLEISNVRGSAGADWNSAGWRIQQKIDSTWMGYIQFNGTASGNNSGGISFGTGLAADTNANAVTERARIDSSGNVLVTSAAGLGYGTGSGGTVTQATSRTTGVTLSKPTGAITMFSAAGSTTAATFTVTNTLIQATDTIILNQKSGTNLYDLLVTAVAAGSFNITFRTTSGTATDAPVINFAIIKGSTS